MGKVARYKESRFCIRRLFLVTVRVFNRDSEKIVLVPKLYLLIGSSYISELTSVHNNKLLNLFLTTCSLTNASLPDGRIFEAN